MDFFVVVAVELGKGGQECSFKLIFLFNSILLISALWDHKTNWICDMISMSFGIMELTLTIFDRYSMAVNMNGK